ncbi:type IV pilin [Natrialbaceae archaeon AArc-T1-2]|uniref:type IV pilin n=1 Tax=Natrialbaceae archaeon AArc-T1-2 TaxID=3053904 RepID=UPI00255AC807|nr:type IV pilin [Natrialbaceae archaeon AArc-T1-2]WIV67960.1 type IV pilin [Natrialbaceae archaeon AArc-T1-2]
MSPRRPLTDEDDGLSPVVGVVLLVGIVVSAMSLILFAVSGYGVFESEPSADLVYYEDSTGGGLEVTIAVSEADRLSEGNTRVQVDGERCDDVWDGSGEVEPGDVVTFDCGGGIDEGDTVQIVWSDGPGSHETLIDTYDVRDD